jgi:integrase
MRVGEVDFAAGHVVNRDKKRVHDRRTTHRVPLSTALAAILSRWLKVHPGGPYLFAQGELVERSKKWSRPTGHLWKDRTGAITERLAGFRRRERPGIMPVTEDEAHDHLKRTLAGSEWEVIRGYHVRRRSFISGCASPGNRPAADKRMGQTDERRRRYRHLYSSVQEEALKSVFG